ncbi:MAG: zinc metallopeptidase [Hyphomicrobiales bacterium]|nr:zinc metallopeptidase [Hyphomicrobiales bacterium]
MLVIIVILLLFGLTMGPTLWVRAVMERYSGERSDFPGTGGELARHLLDEMKLGDVSVERVPQGDHYDPQAKSVRLSAKNYDGRSLTAIVVAAHEVGHAMQDATGYKPLRARSRLAKVAVVVERVGSVVMLAAPVFAGIIRHPAGALLPLGAGFAILSMSVIVHLTTLPVEYDASFRRALPVLRAGRYISDRDMPAARSILRAAAFTYVAAAFMSLINIARWLRVLRI